jgi:2-oxoisovalerate dehydrogenase E2 component (dihydrolipoyl transacylase)
VALTVNMPQLGESVTEGTIARWLKKPGETVAKYESIAEVASDKVNAEIPAPADGTFGEVIAAEGAVVHVGEPICTIEQGGAAAPSAASPEAAPVQAAAAPAQAESPPASQEAAAAGAEPLQVPAAASAQRAAIEEGGVLPAAPSPPPAQPPEVAARASAAPAQAPGGREQNGAVETDRHHLTPAVRMLVREHEVDLDAIQGSGLGGRVTKKDVLDYVQHRDAEARAAGGAAGAPTFGAVTAAPAGPGPAPGQPPAAPVATGAGAAAPAGPTGAEAGEGDQILPMTTARRAIADHMVRSRHTSPHAWLMVEVEMSPVSRIREARKREFKERYGVSLTYLPFVARAVIEGLRRRPSLNAQWSDEGVILKRDIHLGIAVALEENLVVPVLRNADRYSVAGLAQAMADLGERARSNRLKLDEIQGGTFTLNNTGALGAVMTQAIINQPQAAICTMDAVVKRAVVVDEMIAVRPIMNLGLSFDHRLNDGLQAARFLQDVKGILEAMDETALL